MVGRGGCAEGDDDDEGQLNSPCSIAINVSSAQDLHNLLVHVNDCCAAAPSSNSVVYGCAIVMAGLGRLAAVATPLSPCFSISRARPIRSREELNAHLPVEISQEAPAMLILL